MEVDVDELCTSTVTSTPIIRPTNGLLNRPLLKSSPKKIFLDLKLDNFLKKLSQLTSRPAAQEAKCRGQEVQRTYEEIQTGQTADSFGHVDENALGFFFESHFCGETTLTH